MESLPTKVGKKGADHPNWRGGYVRRHLQTVAWRKTREAVFKRDNYTCQKCGEQTSVFAHHINGYRYETDDKDSLDNLVSLCSSCHTSVEWELHKKVNNKVYDYEKNRISTRSLGVDNKQKTIKTANKFIRRIYESTRKHISV